MRLSGQLDSVRYIQIQQSMARDNALKISQVIRAEGKLYLGSDLGGFMCRVFSALCIAHVINDDNYYV